ncbi:MAG TPA: hypothetical protein VJ654_12270 [Noviherbaspirillum sp.]|nr:hypothetical protein [Noviherbaspirillum sp.]
MLREIDFSWLSPYSVLTKAPYRWEKTDPNPTDRVNSGIKCGLLTDAQVIPLTIIIDSVNRHNMELATKHRSR